VPRARLITVLLSVLVLSYCLCTRYLYCTCICTCVIATIYKRYDKPIAASFHYLNFQQKGDSLLFAYLGIVLCTVLLASRFQSILIMAGVYNISIPASTANNHTDVAAATVSMLARSALWQMLQRHWKKPCHENVSS
jgi:hypothetical protein